MEREHGVPLGAEFSKSCTPPRASAFRFLLVAAATDRLLYRWSPVPQGRGDLACANGNPARGPTPMLVLQLCSVLIMPRALVCRDSGGREGTEVAASPLGRR